MDIRFILHAVFKMNSNIPFLKASQYIPTLFFVLYLIVGLFVYDDYGMSWDESLQRDHGLVSAKYVDHWIDYSKHSFHWQDLYDYPHRYYGVWFSMPMAWLEKSLELTTFRQYFHLRHLSVFLLFWLAGVIFYFLLLQRFKHWHWALLGALFWLLSPRIFAHSFYNPKDIPLLCLYVFSLASLYRFWLKPTVGSGLLHALCCAMLISMRVVGLIMPLLSVFLIAVDLLLNKRNEWGWWKKYLWGLITYLPALAAFTILFWPFLWECPLQNLRESFDSMSQYGWGGKVLFNGRTIAGEEVPWYYIPHWIGISTPVLYLLLFGIALTGLLRVLLENIKNLKIWKTDEERKDWAMLGALLAPVLAVIVKESIVYDGWRHLFFIYPCLLYLAVLGANYYWSQLKESKLATIEYIKKGSLLLVSMGLLSTAYFMIKYHPHQNVYFNVFRAGDQFGRYDLDYWGNSYKQGLEAVAQLDDRDTIKVAYQSFPATLNIQYVHPLIQRRVIVVEDVAEADYFVSNFRHWSYGIRQVKERQFPYNGELVHEIWSGNNRILGVYRVEE
jgi:hypothetical protein